MGQQGEGELGAHAGNRAQEDVLLPPHRTLPERLAQLLLQGGQFLRQPGDVGRDVGADASGGSAEAVLLRDQHGQHLVPAARQGVERLGLGVPQRAHGWADRGGEVGQDCRVQRVGLGQLPGGAGEVPDLAGVDDHHRHRRRGQGGHQRQLQATRRLQHHDNRCQGRQPGDQLTDARLVVGDRPAVVRGWTATSN